MKHTNTHTPWGPCALCHVGGCKTHCLESDGYSDCGDKTTGWGADKGGNTKQGNIASTSDSRRSFVETGERNRIAGPSKYIFPKDFPNTMEMNGDPTTLLLLWVLWASVVACQVAQASDHTYTRTLVAEATTQGATCSSNATPENNHTPMDQPRGATWGLVFCKRY